MRGIKHAVDRLREQAAAASAAGGHTPFSYDGHGITFQAADGSRPRLFKHQERHANDGGGYTVALPERRDVSEYLVRAANAHEPLVEALRMFVSLCPHPDGQHRLGGHAPMSAFNIAADKARATLALAEAKP